MRRRPHTYHCRWQVLRSGPLDNRLSKAMHVSDRTLQEEVDIPHCCTASLFEQLTVQLVCSFLMMLRYYEKCSHSIATLLLRYNRQIVWWHFRMLTSCLYLTLNTVDVFWVIAAVNICSSDDIEKCVVGTCEQCGVATPFRDKLCASCSESLQRCQVRSFHRIR